jgi:hypothetical protein
MDKMRFAQKRAKQKMGDGLLIYVLKTTKSQTLSFRRFGHYENLRFIWATTLIAQLRKVHIQNLIADKKTSRLGQTTQARLIT